MNGEGKLRFASTNSNTKKRKYRHDDVQRMTELTNGEDYLWFANANMNVNGNTNTNINTSKMMSRGMMTNGED